MIRKIVALSIAIAATSSAFAGTFPLQTSGMTPAFFVLADKPTCTSTGATSEAVCPAGTVPASMHVIPASEGLPTGNLPTPATIKRGNDPVGTRIKAEIIPGAPTFCWTAAVVCSRLTAAN